MADTGRTGITLFLNVIIRPILLPLLFFFAIVLAVIFSRLIVVGFDIFFKGQIEASSAMGFGWSAMFGWGWKIFLATYLFVMAFKLSHEMMAKTYDFVMRFVNSMGRSDYGTDAPNSDMIAKGTAFGAAFGKIPANAPASPQRRGNSQETAENDGQSGGSAAKSVEHSPGREEIMRNNDPQT